MRKLVYIAALAVPFFINVIPASSQQNPAWLTKEFSGKSLSVENVESFLNNTCQTSGLDGIQLLAVQGGHNQVFNLHVYCRQDKAASAHYKITMAPIPNRNPDAAVNAVLTNPNVRVGPFYFGKDGEPDAFVLVEKTK